MLDEPRIGTTVLSASGVTKRYAGVTALNDVSFDLRAGEVHCLVGENGAGKSTLIKVLTGAVEPDSGRIVLNDVDVTRATMRERSARGVSVIYQDLNLVPQLTVVENIFLGHERRTAHGTLDDRAMEAEAGRLLDSLGVTFPLNSRVGELGISPQQLTATARALSLDGRILIMDEPSAVLGGAELDVLFAVVKRLTEQGIGIIYISHRLEEIFRIGDRVTVLRDGSYISTTEVAEITPAELVRQMVGRDVEAYQNEVTDTSGHDEVLRVEALSRKNVLTDISFAVRAGEVVGVAGLVGAGRTELARAIMGLDPIDSGQVCVSGTPVHVRSAVKAVQLGMALVPEDRRAEGLVPMLSVRTNASLSILKAMSPFGIVRFKAMYEKVGKLISGMAVKTSDVRQPVSGLSGGNQQKVVLARCLASNCRLLILDEPTVGIDVGAKKEIYTLIGELKANGMAVLMISSELPEILAVSDRILVMANGAIEGELDPRTTSQEEILSLAIPRMAEQLAGDES